MAKIDTNKYKVKELFGENNWFEIPNYQRNYVWKPENIINLLENIKEFKPDSKDGNDAYFLGSLVLQKKDKGESITYYDVLDGQQRLTTLLLIMSVGRDLLETQKDRGDVQTYIKTSKSPIHGIEKDSNKITFSIQGNAEEFCRKFVYENDKNDESYNFGKINNKYKEIEKHKNDKDTSVRNMSIALTAIREYFQNFSSKEEIREFISKILNNTHLVTISTENEDDAFRLFTILNSTGMRLSNADILKAENLRVIEDKKEKDELAKTWEEIEEYFNRELGKNNKEDGFDSFLTFILDIYLKQKAKKTIYKEFEDNIYKNPNMFITKGKKTFKVIEEYYKIYKTVIGLETEEANRFKNSLSEKKYNEYANLVTILRDYLKCDDWIPPLLAYYNKFKTEGIWEFFKKLEEKTLCDFFVGERDTKRRFERYKIIKLIQAEGKLPDDILNSEELKNSNKEKAIKKLHEEGLYDDKRCCKYMLLRYECLHTDDPIPLSNHLTIEHVLPQTPEEDSQWKKDFTDENLKYWTHNIANLIVIKDYKNSKTGNKDFKKKKECLRNLPQKDWYTGTNDIINKYEEWTPDVLQNRLEEMCKELFP